MVKKVYTIIANMSGSLISKLYITLLFEFVDLMKTFLILMGLEQLYIN